MPTSPLNTLVEYQSAKDDLYEFGSRMLAAAMTLMVADEPGEREEKVDDFLTEQQPIPRSPMPSELLSFFNLLDNDTGKEDPPRPMSRNSISASEILREDSDSGAYIETDEVADEVNIMKRITSEKREKMEDIATALGDLHAKVLRWRGKESQHLRSYIPSPLVVLMCRTVFDLPYFWTL